MMARSEVPLALCWSTLAQRTSRGIMTKPPPTPSRPPISPPRKPIAAKRAALRVAVTGLRLGGRRGSRSRRSDGDGVVLEAHVGRGRQLVLLRLLLLLVVAPAVVSALC